MKYKYNNRKYNTKKTRKKYRKNDNKKNNNVQNNKTIVSVISFIIRQFFIPNPFSNLVHDSCTANVYNAIFGIIFVLLSFELTGGWYDKKNSKIGATGFLFNYILITFLFLLITKVIKKIIFAIIIFLLVYALLFLIEKKVFSKNRNKYY